MNFFFRLPIYPCGIVVSSGSSTRKLKKFLRKKKIKYGKYLKGRVSEGRSISFGDGWILVRFKDKKPTHNAVAHELYHTVNHVMNYIEMPFDNANDEAFAYLTGYLTDKLYKKLKVKK